MNHIQNKVIRNNNNVQEFINSGDADLAAKNLSAGYLLISLGDYFINETLNLFEKHDLFYGKIKTKASNFENVFDGLEKEISQYIQKDAKTKLVDDYEQLNKIVEQMFNINNNK